jgi:hypothetical protein
MEGSEPLNKANANTTNKKRVIIAKTLVVHFILFHRIDFLVWKTWKELLINAKV